MSTSTASEREQHTLFLTFAVKQNGRVDYGTVLAVQVSERHGVHVFGTPRRAFQSVRAKAKRPSTTRWVANSRLPAMRTVASTELFMMSPPQPGPRDHQPVIAPPNPCR